jgi:hypothetical protein
MTTDIAVRGPVRDQPPTENGGAMDYEQQNNENAENENYDDNSSSRLFERHRIKALAGKFPCHSI